MTKLQLVQPLSFGDMVLRYHRKIKQLILGRYCRYHQLRQNFCFCKRRSTTAIQWAEHPGNRYQNGPEVGIGINVKNAFSQPYVKSPVVSCSMDIPTSPSGSQDRKVCPCIPDRSLRWAPPRNPTGCKPG